MEKPTDENYLFIQEYIINTIDKIINKWEDIKTPFRKVMIECKKCYMCRKTQKYIYEISLDSFDGIYNQYGFLFCKSCKIYANLAEEIYYKNADFLPYNSCYKLKNKILKFKRISSNKKIKPYIETGSLELNNGNYIFKRNGNLYLTIQWVEKSDYFAKSILLNNAIFYNREIFGYYIEECPIVLKYDKWISDFKKVYNETNELYYISLVLKSKKLPYFIINCLFHFLVKV